MTRLETMPLDDIAWGDLSALIGAEESLTLEFKRDLSSKKGGLHGWHEGGPLDPYARDALAQEVVAFANSWGGTLVLGAAERSDGDRNVCDKLIPLPRASELAQQIEDSLNGVIEPPLPSLNCRAVASTDDPTRGIVLIRVARSTAAPHGFTAPARAYVRRGTRASPMSMGEIQTAFWDSRTRAGRIEEQRRRAEHFLNERMVAGGKLHLPKADGVVFARYSAYPHEALGLEFDPSEIWVRLLRPEEGSLYSQRVVAPFGGGSNDWSPQPIAHGIRNLSEGARYSSLWNIGEDGSIQLWGACAASRSQTGLLVVHPSWFVTALGQFIVMAEHLRRRARKPGVPYEIDCSFIGSNCRSDTRRSLYERVGRDLEMDEPIDCGPFLFAKASSAGSVFSSIERAVWHGFGIAHVENLDFEFVRGLQALEGSMERSGVRF
jgi:hypothetical protein